MDQPQTQSNRLAQLHAQKEKYVQETARLNARAKELQLAIRGEEKRAKKVQEQQDKRAVSELAFMTGFASLFQSLTTMDMPVETLDRALLAGFYLQAKDELEVARQSPLVLDDLRQKGTAFLAGKR